MIKVGDDIYNPVTGTRFHILALSDTGFTIEQTVEAGKKTIHAQSHAQNMD